MAAFEKCLDISNLLDSKLCSYILEAEEVEHFYRFPGFHFNDKKATVNFKNSFMELLHDEEAYEQNFGEDYPFDIEDQKNLIKSTKLSTNRITN